MGKKISSKLWLAALIAPFLFGVAQTSFATSEVQRLFVKEYSQFNISGGKLDTCATCHSPSIREGFNNYGLVLKLMKTPEGKFDFVGAEALDGDGDGVSNGDEIRANNFPGSQASEEGVFIFTNGKGTVEFNHGNHVVEEDYGINGNCDSCHNSPTAKASFSMLFEDSINMKSVAHDVCLGCHKRDPDKIAPTGCSDCHVK